MSIARDLITADRYTVEVAGLTFELESIDNEALVKAGAVQLRMVAPGLRDGAPKSLAERQDEALAAATKAKGKKLTKDERQEVLDRVAQDAQAESMEFLARINERDLVAYAKAKDAAVCAAVVALNGEDIRFVLDRAREDHEATPGRVHIDRLPGSVRAALYDALEKHQGMSEEGLAESLAKFRGQPGASPNA